MNDSFNKYSNKYRIIYNIEDVAGRRRKTISESGKATRLITRNLKRIYKIIFER